MGYTHYWDIDGSLTAEDIAILAPDVEAIVLASEVPLADGHGEPGTHPTIGRERIWLNGTGDDAHETFGFTVGASGFDFCKTAYKPYDVVVTASLLAARDRWGSRIRLSSDGNAPDWLAGHALAERALHRTIEPFA